MKSLIIVYITKILAYILDKLIDVSFDKNGTIDEVEYILNKKGIYIFGEISDFVEMFDTKKMFESMESNYKNNK